MIDGLVDTASQIGIPDDRRILGVALGVVINNRDETQQGRVQVRLPWLPGYEPWARVATLVAGSDQGIYFMPQVDDEVLVAFAHGDISEPFVVGCLWNGKDHSPATSMTDALNKRLIRTPKGHQLVLDDAEQSIIITGAAKGQISITKEKIELSIGEASITLEKSGKVTLKTSGTLTLDAKTINVTAKNDVSIGGQQGARIDGGKQCTINAAQISIG